MGIQRSQLSLALLIPSPQPDGPLDEFECALPTFAVHRFDRYGETAVLGLSGRLGPRGNNLVCPDALWDECKALGGCPTGEARISGGHDLPNRYVIHTVGPVYSGTRSDAVLLKACYVNSLRLADKFHIRSVSFPALSTGIFGYPVEDAAAVSIAAIWDYL